MIGDLINLSTFNFTLCHILLKMKDLLRIFVIIYIQYVFLILIL